MHDLICIHGLGAWHWIVDLWWLFGAGALFAFHSGKAWCQCLWCKIKNKGEKNVQRRP